MYFGLAIIYFALLLAVVLFLAGATRLANRVETERKVSKKPRRLEQVLVFRKRYRDAA